MTRSRFFGFLLPLAIAGSLALGLSAAPAGAHDCVKHNRPDHPHCAGDPSPDTGEPALLDLGGDMLAMDLDVRVKQDTTKRLQFADTSFGPPGIRMNMDESLGNCEFDPRFNTKPFSDPTIGDLQTELSSAVIPAGFLIGRIDKKKKTAELVIEYFVPPVASVLPDGRIRIYFREFPPRTGNFGEVTFVTEEDLDFPDTDLAISGSIAIWWEDEHDLNGSKILVCDDHEVTVVLTEPEGPQ